MQNSSFESRMVCSGNCLGAVQNGHTETGASLWRVHVCLLLALLCASLAVAAKRPRPQTRSPPSCTPSSGFSGLLLSSLYPIVCRHSSRTGTHYSGKMRKHITGTEPSSSSMLPSCWLSLNKPQTLHTAALLETFMASTGRLATS